MAPGQNVALSLKGDTGSNWLIPIRHQTEGQAPALPPPLLPQRSRIQSTPSAAITDSSTHLSPVSRGDCGQGDNCTPMKPRSLESITRCQHDRGVAIRTVSQSHIARQRLTCISHQSFIITFLDHSLNSNTALLRSWMDHHSTSCSNFPAPGLIETPKRIECVCTS